MMRAAPIRYCAALGFVAAPHSGLMTRQRVPVPQACASVAHLTTYQRRFKTTANTPWKQLKTKAATTGPNPDPDGDVFKGLEAHKREFQAAATKSGVPGWILAMSLKHLAKDKSLAAKIAGNTPKLVAYSDYIACLAAKPSILGEFVLVPQLRSRPAGLSTLARTIKTHVGNLRRTLKTNDYMQYTAALVIQNASGVGNTFGSVAAAGVLNRKGRADNNADYYLPVHIGLNDVFPMTEAEIDLLCDQSQRTDMHRIRAVIGRRLLLQLMFISKKLVHGKLKLWDVVESKEYRGFHNTPAPAKEAAFNSQLEFPLFDKMVVARCAELIQRLSEYCDGRKLVVLFIMDEGQQLDQFVVPNANGGGARLALQFGRELQLSCSQSTKNAFLLTMMTGINPQTALSHATEGKNYSYCDPLHTVKEFAGIALELDRGRYNVKRQERSRRLAALFYPVVRDMALVYAAKGSQPFKSILPYGKVVLAASRAQLMVMASGTETYLDNSYWETPVPATFRRSHFLPVMSFYQLCDYYLPHFKGLQLGTDTFGVSAQTALRYQDHNKFEASAFDILNAILAVTNMTGEPEKSIAAEYERMRKAWLAGNKWFDLALGTGVSLSPIELCDFWDGRHQCHLPSSIRKSHEVAFSVKRGRNTHPLHPDARAQLDGLMNEGQIFSMVCGGSAPVDFIFVVMKTSRNKDTDPCEVELRLADAKYTAPGTVTKVEEMLGKFSLVSQYLSVALKNECHMTVTRERFAIVTNQKDARQSMLNGCDSKLEGIKAKTHVLSPATLRFSPLTTRLFN